MANSIFQLGEVELIFTRTDSPLSRIIRAITGEEYSHCAFGGFYAMGGETSDVTDVIPLVLHSDLRGVVFESMERFFERNTVVSVIRIPVELDIRSVGKSLGNRYDFSAIAGYFPVIFWRRLFREPMKNILACSNAQVCSEFMVRELANVIPFFKQFDPETTTPGKLFEAAEKFRKLVDQAFPRMDQN